VNVAEALVAQARARPHDAAIVAGRRGDTVTFAELEQASARRAGFLREAGLGPGDVTLVFQPISADLYVTLIAIFRLGAVAMFLDPSGGRAEIDRGCAVQAPRALIATPKAHLLRLLSPALRRVPLKFSTGPMVPGARWMGAARHAPRFERVEPRTPEAPALLTFTSGSTGQPKAALRSHGFLLAQHRVLERTLELRPGGADLTTLPIFVLANLGSGLTTLLPDADLRRPGSIDPRPVLAQIRRHRPHRTAASPAFLERLLEGARAEGGRIAGLERIFTGGAPVFPRLLDALAEAAPQARIAALYGSTEAEPIAHLERSEITADDRAAMRSGRGLLAGRPVDEVRVAILPDRWGQPPAPMSCESLLAESLPRGEAGEIVVSGDHVLAGYLGGVGDEETKIAVDGAVWHRTGDAGYLDEGGRLWLLGRCAARIEDDRGTVYPFAVECAASGEGGVQRTAFVAHRGRRVLLVEPQSGGSRPDLSALGAALGWARLDDVRLVPRLPVDRRHNAKIDYVALARLLDRGEV
jgi:acyl-CoA synthetase (AMP-forming)/AMP-acid ligase II